MCFQGAGMTIERLKAADRPANERDPQVQATVADMLEELRRSGEPQARTMAADFDGWTGDIVVDQSEIDAAAASLDPQTIADIHHAHEHILAFAEAQVGSIRSFDIELEPGLRVGQRLVPVQTAGCYVPAGRFAHVASALMSVTTAAAAGVDTIVVASPARPDRGGVHPAILYSAQLAGAHHILGLGGVQGVGAMALGLFTGSPADVIVGPGNSYVAEAKRQLFGQVGIDVVAGPTESMIVADASADPHTVATDLVGQAEHGPDSPVWLVTTSRALAEAVAELVEPLAAALPEPACDSALTAWRNHGEIIVTDTDEEAATVCDEYAPEHLQVLCEDLDWWLNRLRNYGSLFLGPETTVTFGDKTSGPNHILPTGTAARYSGGLNPLRFLKQLTWQQLTPEAGDREAGVAARISRLEGMEGHARSADLRVVGASGLPA